MRRLEMALVTAMQPNIIVDGQNSFVGRGPLVESGAASFAVLVDGPQTSISGPLRKKAKIEHGKSCPKPRLSECKAKPGILVTSNMWNARLDWHAGMNTAVTTTVKYPRISSGAEVVHPNLHRMEIDSQGRIGGDDDKCDHCASSPCSCTDFNKTEIYSHHTTKLLIDRVVRPRTCDKNSCH